MVKNKPHLFRLVPLFMILISTMIMTFFLSYFQGLYFDEQISILFLDFAFFMLFLFELEYERITKGIAYNSSTTFTRVAIGYIVSCILTIGFAFLPAFCKPVMLLVLLMSALSNEFISVTAGMFFAFMLALTGQDSIFELICYCMLILFGALLAKTLESQKYHVLISVLIVCINIIITTTMYYLENQEISVMVIGSSVGIGIICALFTIIFYRFIRKDTLDELKNRLLDIISEDYFQVQELKSYMPADYEHACKVSDLAARCAKHLELSEQLCRVGAFYYRLGKWQGEPHVENGINKALSLCFPTEIVQILAEYYGEKEYPSTPESAIVQMVDALVIKFDALSADVDRNLWNQEMVIYQTLNEFSNSGIYDYCGLSMNQFLKAREFLAKEKLL